MVVKAVQTCPVSSNYSLLSPLRSDAVGWQLSGPAGPAALFCCVIFARPVPGVQIGLWQYAGLVDHASPLCWLSSVHAVLLSCAC